MNEMYQVANSYPKAAKQGNSAALANKKQKQQILSVR
jgi:hypothetical protein